MMAGTTFSKGVDNLVELTKAASNLQDRDHDLRMGIRRLMHHELDLVVKSIVDAETDHLAKSLQQLTYVLPELGDWHELAGVIAEVFKKLESRKIVCWLPFRHHPTLVEENHTDREPDDVRSSSRDAVAG